MIKLIFMYMFILLLLEVFDYSYCPKCKKYFKWPKVRRMSSNYLDDEQNYIYVCAKCFYQIEEYWEECWRERYNEVMM